MSIKTKTSIILFAAAMLLCFAVFIISQTILVENLLDQENELTKQYLQRVNIALEHKSRSLDSTIADWAEWDDTYNFVQDKNEQYMKSNLTESALINIRLNLIAYIDIHGNIVYGTMLDLDSQKMSEVNQNILEHFQKDGLIISQTAANKNISGFLAVPEGILLISSKAILKSDRSGPVIGTLVFGRFINDKEIAEIQELTGIPFSIERLNSSNMPSGLEKVIQSNGREEQYYVHAIDDNNIAGYSIMNDIYGENKFLVKTVTDRKFYQKAKESTNFFIISILICAFVIIILSMAIHQKLVTSRLLELNKFITKIGSKHDTSLRVQVSGNDEISTLADEMNRMLEELNKTHEDNQRLIGEVLGYDELKNEFFSNISHEFRTPINVLLSTLQLINLKQQNNQAGSNPFDVEKYTNIMKQNCYRLLRLSNNLIDISKIDSGFFEINPSNCNVVGIIEEITLSVAEYMKDKGISLQFDTDVEEKVVSIDAEKIERIMLNLLSNAIKFTEDQGSIFVNIKDKGDSIEVSVKDTGIGIPEDKLSIIFERFRQVNSSLTRSHEGSGIGLSLVKNLVELHGGSIRVDSEYGKGAEFIFTLPAKVCSEESEQTLPPMTSPGKVDKINIEFSDIYS